MARLVLPNGFGHGWRRDTPDHRDHALSMKLKAPKPLPDTKWLKPDALPKVRDQGNLGSCTGFSITGALMWSYKAKRANDVALSPLYAYFRARVLEASVKEDSGAELRDVVKAASDAGVSLEKYWPYKEDKFAHAPTKTADANAKSHQVAVGYYSCGLIEVNGVKRPASPAETLENILQALNADMAVPGGFSCFANLDQAAGDGRIPMPGPKDALQGGHANWWCGFDRKERLLLSQNSWGAYGAKHPVTGEQGYFWLPFDFVLQQLADDFWAILHE